VGTGRERLFAGLAEMFEFLIVDTAGEPEAEPHIDSEIG
jgi:hypothetical protein